MKIGLLADAHGNVESFDVALGVLQDHGAEDVYFLGDAVGYLPGASVIGRLDELDITCLMGNHEAMLLDGASDKEEIYRLGETAALLAEEHRALIEGWPHRIERQASCGRLVMVHGSPADPLFGYIYPDSPLDPGNAPTTVFMGATHRPFVRKEGQTTYVNVGSCGLPRDCGHLGSACLFDDVTGAATILRFDISDATSLALDRCGPVADDVLDVFNRRGDCYGEKL